MTIVPDLLPLLLEYEQSTRDVVPQQFHWLVVDSTIKIIGSVYADPRYPFTSDFIQGCMAAAWANDGTYARPKLAFGEAKYRDVMITHPYLPINNNTYVYRNNEYVKLFRLCIDDVANLPGITPLIATQLTVDNFVVLILDNSKERKHNAWFFTTPDFITGMMSVLDAFQLEWNDRAYGRPLHIGGEMDVLV